MFLILCEPRDYSALWVARGLERLGIAPIEIVAPQSLVLHRRFEHRIQPDGVLTRITLADGRIIDSRSVRGTINRMAGIPLDHLAQTNPADRQFAEQEFFAVFLSWLHGLPGPIFNRPTARGLPGSSLRPSEWISLAARAGLPTVTYLQSDRFLGSVPPPEPGSRNEAIIVCNGSCYGFDSPPETVQAGCRRLVELSGDSLLGLWFSISPRGEWRFAEANSLPDLRPGGDPLLEEIAKGLLS